MILNRGRREIIEIYNSLIKLSYKNMDKRIRVEWGYWVPTERGLATLLSRRDKLSKGIIDPSMRILTLGVNYEWRSIRIYIN